jgi:hypothetical protein
MSSIRAFATIESRERPARETMWGEPAQEYDLTNEIGDEEVRVPRSPVVVDGDKLEINSALLDVGSVFSFEYLGAQMVLWKLPSGAVDLFEVVEE